MKYGGDRWLRQGFAEEIGSEMTASREHGNFVPFFHTQKHEHMRTLDCPASGSG